MPAPVAAARTLPAASPLSSALSTCIARKRSMVARAEGRRRSAMSMRPITRCCAATKMWLASSSGSVHGMPRWVKNDALPTTTARPSTVPSTPAPRTARTSLDDAIASPRARAAATIACASGWVDADSTRCCERKRIVGTARTYFGRAAASAFRSYRRGRDRRAPRVRARAESLKSTPRRDAAPTPATIAVGVASPSAQGQATTSTATAATNAYAPRVMRDESHPANVTSATIRIAGTKIPATRSASRCTGGVDPCARRTIIDDTREFCSRAHCRRAHHERAVDIERALFDGASAFDVERYRFAG